MALAGDTPSPRHLPSLWITGVKMDFQNLTQKEAQAFYGQDVVARVIAASVKDWPDSFTTVTAIPIRVSSSAGLIAVRYYDEKDLLDDAGPVEPDHFEEICLDYDDDFSTQE